MKLHGEYHIEDCKDKADALLWEAKFRLQMIESDKHATFKHDRIEWARKVIDRCQDIRDKVHDYWEEFA